MLLAAVAAAFPSSARAAKTDLLTLQNGDRITGEVKWLTRGKLDYSTDDAGRLAIEWVKVARLTSPSSFEVETTSGAKYVGRLVASGRDGVIVVGGEVLDTLVIPEVVAINVLNASFMKRVRAYLDLGLTFAKANQATTFTTEGEAAYRGDTIGSTFAFNSYAQGQESAPTATRNSVSARLIRFLPKRWSLHALGQTEQNDELNLDFRLTGAAAVGRAVSRSNSSELGGGVGLAVTRERFTPALSDTTGEAETGTNLEALLFATWDAFRFDSPTLDFGTSLYLYPSLSNTGRVRGEATLRLKYELISDFDIGISATDTFDSDPPEETATTNDFIMSFTIGWSYRR
jgi:Protein of unknown function, DUF481